MVVTAGAALVTLDRVDSGRTIDVQAQVRTGSASRTFVLGGTVAAKLRPDLVVTSVQAPLQTLTTRAVDVVAEVAEVKGDTAPRPTSRWRARSARWPARRRHGSGRRQRHGHVPGRRADDAGLDRAAGHRLGRRAGRVRHRRTSRGRATVEVTKNELVPLQVLVPSLGGYGFQFNGHLYAPITNPAPATLPDLESKVKALEPQLVRIFYNDNWEANADKTHPEWQQNLESFKDTVALAQESGATVVIAYQTRRERQAQSVALDGALRRRPAGPRRDARTDERAVGPDRERAEHDSAALLSKEQYKALYRALDAALVARGLRDQIGLIGGDLVENNEGTAGCHRAWFDYMVTNMNDVIDAWSEHIYWNYWDHFRMEERLKDVAHLVRQELPASAQKPTLLLEYGVRGMNSCGTKPTVTAAYYNDASCTELRRMSLAAFHKLWFTIASAQLGLRRHLELGSLLVRLRQDEEQPVVLDDRATGGGLGALSVVLRVPAAPADDGSGLAGAPGRSRDRG